jgi:hypothetical protein
VLPDVIAAALLNPLEGEPTPPRIVRALRLEAVGEQPGLRSVRLRGGKTIDPSRDDPFVEMIHERQRVLRDSALDEEERKRLERFLKITANATSYGVLARFDRRPRGKAVSVTVYGPDEEPRPEAVPAVEDPGPFAFPPVAASITAGGKAAPCTARAARARRRRKLRLLRHGLDGDRREPSRPKHPLPDRCGRGLRPGSELGARAEDPPPLPRPQSLRQGARAGAVEGRATKHESSPGLVLRASLPPRGPGG